METLDHNPSFQDGCLINMGKDVSFLVILVGLIFEPCSHFEAHSRMGVFTKYPLLKSAYLFKKRVSSKQHGFGQAFANGWQWSLDNGQTDGSHRPMAGNYIAFRPGDYCQPLADAWQNLCFLGCLRVWACFIFLGRAGGKCSQEPRDKWAMFPYSCV